MHHSYMNKWETRNQSKNIKVWLRCNHSILHFILILLPSSGVCHALKQQKIHRSVQKHFCQRDFLLQVLPCRHFPLYCTYNTWYDYTSSICPSMLQKRTNYCETILINSLWLQQFQSKQVLYWPVCDSTNKYTLFGIL